MVKKFLSIASLAAVIFIQPNTANAQAVEEGTVLIDAYYGFPNLYGTTFKKAYANSDQQMDVNISSLGPVGLRGEYLVSDKIGIGLDLGFNNTKLNFKEVSFYDGKTYDYDYKTQKIGAMVTFNYHFIESNDNLDAYFMVGAGYANRSFEFSSTDPNYSAVKADGILPIASRLGVGMRYFFTDNLGANLAIGFGQGGLLNGGLSLRF